MLDYNRTESVRIPSSTITQKIVVMSTRMFSNTSSALLLVLFSLLVICGKRPKIERKWEAKLDKLMAPCADSENSTLSLTFHNIICNSDNIVVNLDVVAQNDLPSPFLVFLL